MMGEESKKSKKEQYFLFRIILSDKVQAVSISNGTLSLMGFVITLNLTKQKRWALLSFVKRQFW